MPKNGQAEELLNEKESYLWIKPEIGMRFFSSLSIGMGAHAGFAFFNTRLALGVEANGLLHMTVERHVGSYLRVVAFARNPAENIYLIGRFNRGSIMAMPTPSTMSWEPLSVQMYGAGFMKYGQFGEAGVRIYENSGFALPYISFGINL